MSSAHIPPDAPSRRLQRHIHHILTLCHQHLKYTGSILDCPCRGGSYRTEAASRRRMYRNVKCWFAFGRIYKGLDHAVELIKRGWPPVN